MDLQFIHEPVTTRWCQMSLNGMGPLYDLVSQKRIEIKIYIIIAITVLRSVTFSVARSNSVEAFKTCLSYMFFSGIFVYFLGINV